MPSKDESYTNEEDDKEPPQLINVFSMVIMEARSLYKLKIPHLKSFKWKINLMDYIAYFDSKTSLMDLDDSTKSWPFFTTFKKIDLRWFFLLLLKIITSFTKLERMFTT